MKKFKNWWIIETITGRNKAGKIGNKVLPLRKQREFVGEILKGGKDLLPIPQVKDASLVQDAAEIKEIMQALPDDVDELHQKMEKYPDIVTHHILKIKDLLDDGRLNDSAGGLSPETKFKIRLTTSILLCTGFAYQVAALIFGWPQIPFFNFVGV